MRADHYQMEQILMNLAVNARDAMPGGGKLCLETASLDIGADGAATRFSGSDAGFHARLPADLPAGPWVVLRVQDNGVGMSEETRAHVFEPFFTTKDEGKGSGLGLSTVYGIVTQSGGRVRVDSAPGQRERRSPSAFPACAAGSGRRRGRKTTPPGPGRGSGTVLLVEDEADVRELARSASWKRAATR